MVDDKRDEAVKASIASVQRIAMRLADLPPEKREEALEIVRQNYADGIKHFGGDAECGPYRRWLDIQMEGLRALVSEIGDRSGKA